MSEEEPKFIQISSHGSESNYTEVFALDDTGQVWRHTGKWQSGAWVKLTGERLDNE